MEIKIGSVVKKPRLKILRILFPWVLLRLSSCASWYDVGEGEGISYHQPQQVDYNFSISGRFIVRHAAKDYFGNFSWAHVPGQDRLSMYSTWGITIAQIRVENKVSQLTVEGKTYYGEDLDKLLESHLGFSLPLVYLHYWIQGSPLPGVKVEQKFNQGFQQLLWQVKYLQWQENNRPQIIELSQSNLKIKLLIKW